MIPKVIHYCWFSEDPFPPKIAECIASWKKHMPDYQIKRWSAKNFDINAVKLVREAYNAKKWAFATDYIRLYTLYNEGGIYLDSDILLHQNIESYLQSDYVSAIEFHPIDQKAYKQSVSSDYKRKESVSYIEGVGLQAAFMASIPHHPFVEKSLAQYENISLDQILERNLLAPIMQALAAEPFGFSYIDKEQHLSNSITLYPTSVIGQNAYETKGRIATHLCAGSWENSLLKHKIIDLLNNRWHILPYFNKLLQLYKKLH
jgi:mannosyltransferase OCH1-like enzyme